MVKRGSPSKNAGNAAKVAKVATPPPEDPFVEKCQPVFDALSEAENLAVPATDMLQSALVFCLKTPPSDRHAYERSVVQMIEEVLAAELARRRGVVAEAEKTQSVATAEHEATVGKLEEQKGTTERFNAVKEQKDQAYNDAVKQCEEAAAVLSAAKASVEALAAERQQQQDTLEEYEKTVSDNWVPLKENTLKGHDRKKALGHLLRKLPAAGVPDSLAKAIDIALKTSSDTRGQFSNLAIEHGEAGLTRYIEELKGKIAGFEDESSRRNAAVSDANGKQEAAATQKKVALDEVIAAENAWVDENTKSFNMQNSVDGWANKSKELADTLSEANEAVSDYQESISKFEAIRDAVEPAGEAAGHIVFPSPSESPAEPAEPLFPSPSE